jgi:hypothetical protein
MYIALGAAVAERTLSGLYTLSYCHAAEAGNHW